MKAILLAVALGSAASAASAAPLSNQVAPVVTDRAPLVQEVKVVCEANGVCYRPPGRPLVAKWVYGDTTFYGPYVGPGNYGAPGRHYNMTPSWLWWGY